VTSPRAIPRCSRREFLALTAASLARAQDADAIVVDPTSRFEISPLLYMQFMEPLGTADSSVEASWDYDADDWRKDFVDVTRELAPGALRFGGLFSRYYKWREGVGPAARRPAMRNYVWGGWETNRVGTHEFVDFCRRVGAEPFYCVNFLSDGEKRYAARTGDAREAADWVSYANDPDSRERKANGAAAPLNLKLWQLGNETSYGNVTFSKEDAIVHTVAFARAMKQRDPSIKLIGWGDRGRDGKLWAPDMQQEAGEHLDYLAMHMMGQGPKRPDTVLKGLRYQREPERAWEELLELANAVERRVAEFEQASTMPIAVTEGHLSLGMSNGNPLLYEWLSAAYHARSLNIYQRHGARVKIATAADFNGTRWTNTAVMLPAPRGRSYLMPVGSIAALFKRYNGAHAVEVKRAPAGLDVAASRSGDTLFLHVANLEYGRAVEASFPGTLGGAAHEIAPDDPRAYVSQDQPEAFRPRDVKLPRPRWRFPARSVTALELALAPA
jgi:alpha-L-arabinofuranosidase